MNAPSRAPSTVSITADPRIARAAINLPKFLALAAQLAALLVVFFGFSIDESGFRRLSVCCYVGFVLHYFLPFRWKKPGFVLISLIGGYVVLNDPAVQSINLPLLVGTAVCIMLALGYGVSVYLCLRLRISFWLRLFLVLMISGLMVLGAINLWLPPRVWQVVGSIFMFRMIIYAYDVKASREPERLSDFLCYFFLLPNFYFVLFPVIDYTTFKRGYYAAEIHANAQRGIAWIVRGAIHLCLYRLVYHEVLISPEEVNSFWMLCRYIFPAWWLYLEVSGKFHIIIGTMHLFGWQLPETNRLYFVSSSFTDFWRRINIYWKDFMVKVFYYPVYFRFRRMNEVLALTLGVIAVFAATAILHGWQFFWIQGSFDLPIEDTIFWTILAVLVWINVLLETRAKPKVKQSGAKYWTRRVFSTVIVYVTISILWSMWSTKDLAGWLETVMYWR